MKLVMEMDFQNPNCSAICQAGNNYIELTNNLIPPPSNLSKLNNSFLYF